MNTPEIVPALIGAVATIIAAILAVIVRKLHIKLPKLPTWKNTRVFLLHILWVTITVYVAGKIASMVIPPRIALKSHDDKYVTALNAAFGWAIKASSDTPNSCSYFTLIRQKGSKDVVTLKTCYARYVTAMDNQKEWNLVAETKMVSNWEKFTLIDLGNNQIALKTSHDRYVTAMNNQPGWDWELRGETQQLSTWEVFKRVSKPWISIYLATAIAFFEVTAWYIFRAWRRNRTGKKSASKKPHAAQHSVHPTAGTRRAKRESRE